MCTSSKKLLQTWAWIFFILYGYSYAHGNTFFYKNGVLFIHVLSLQPGLVLTGMCCRLWIMFLRLYYPLLVNEPSHKKFSVPHDIDVYTIMNISICWKWHNQKTKTKQNRAMSWMQMFSYSMQSIKQSHMSCMQMFSYSMQSLKQSHVMHANVLI